MAAGPHRPGQVAGGDRLRPATGGRRLTVGVYLETTHGLGGGEAVAAVLTAALAERFDTTLVHHHPGLTADTLAERFGVDVGRVRLRYEPVVRGQTWGPPGRKPWHLRHDLREWKAGFSRGFDRFVGIVHGVPPHCHAPAGALLVLFPVFDRRTQWPFAGGGLRGLPRRLLHRALWADRLRSYTTAVSISRYTEDWTRRLWNLPTTVVYPPLPDAPVPAAKRDLIAAVGRFAPMKRQDELVTLFAGSDLPGRGWRFDCVGGLGDLPEERTVFERAKAAAGAGVSVRADLPRRDVLDLLGAAKVLWHAAGVGLDADREPWLLEHFGIAPAEAMSAGCVPVVADRGGPAEVVTDGATGFVCRELGEFVARTRQLAADEPLRARMSAAAVDDSRRFGKAAFLAGMEQALAKVLPRGWAGPLPGERPPVATGGSGGAGSAWT